MNRGSIQEELGYSKQIVETVNNYSYNEYVNSQVEDYNTKKETKELKEAIDQFYKTGELSVLKDRFFSNIGKAFKKVGEDILEFFKAIFDFFKKIFNIIFTFLKNLQYSILGFQAFAFGIIVGTAIAIGIAVFEIVAQVFEKILDLIEGLLEILKNVFRTIFRMIISGLQGIIFIILTGLATGIGVMLINLLKGIVLVQDTMIVRFVIFIATNPLVMRVVTVFLHVIGILATIMIARVSLIKILFKKA